MGESSMLSSVVESMLEARLHSLRRGNHWNTEACTRFQANTMLGQYSSTQGNISSARQG